MIKTLIGSVTAVALAAGAAAPAAARPYWGGGGGYGHHRHHGGGDTFGNILLGAVIAGGAIAVVSAANKNKGVASRRGSDQRDDLRQDGEDAREVAAMCSDAVENMARGRIASIDSVGRDGKDGWRVDGIVDGERGDRHFFCGVREGQIDTVELGDRMAAR